MTQRGSNESEAHVARQGQQRRMTALGYRTALFFSSVAGSLA